MVMIMTTWVSTELLGKVLQVVVVAVVGFFCKSIFYAVCWELYNFDDDIFMLSWKFNWNSKKGASAASWKRDEEDVNMST